MRYLVIFVFVTLFFTAALYLIKVTVVVEFKKNGHNDYFSITFSLFWGLLKYEYEIPLIDIEKQGIKMRRAKKIKPGTVEKGEGRKKVSFSEIYDRVSFFIDFYKKNRNIICKVRDYTREKFMIEEYSLKVEAGTGDAFQTGILSGLLWTVTGILTSYVMNNFRTGKTSVDIMPAFSDEKLSIDFLCIFGAKIANIITVILMLYINYKQKTRKAKLRHMIGGGLVG